jgi:(4S)-4-hydroxy-5-phosphonooxypentane-2,3-dione isomerase
MFVITVRFAVKAGFEQPFLQRVSEQARDSLDRETGCRQFDVCRSETDPRRVFLYEVYDDAAAFAGHLQSPHFLAFDVETRSWVDEKVAEPWTRVEAPRAAAG